MGGRQSSLKNLRASPFNKDLSNETIFAWNISLDITFKCDIEEMSNKHFFPICLQLSPEENGKYNGSSKNQLQS